MRDHKIVQLLREGKESIAFRKLYSCYPKIEKLILSNGGSKSDAEDLFQEALIIFYEKVQQSNFELRSSISTYLQILRRKRIRQVIC